MDQRRFDSLKNNYAHTLYKNNSSILGLTKVSCRFTTSDFTVENPHTETRNYSVTTTL